MFDAAQCGRARRRLGRAAPGAGVPPLDGDRLEHERALFELGSQGREFVWTVPLHCGGDRLEGGTDQQLDLHPGSGHITPAAAQLALEQGDEPAAGGFAPAQQFVVTSENLDEVEAGLVGLVRHPPQQVVRGQPQRLTPSGLRREYSGEVVLDAAGEGVVGVVQAGERGRVVSIHLIDREAGLPAYALEGQRRESFRADDRDRCGSEVGTGGAVWVAGRR